jgi:hypothetical protein
MLEVAPNELAVARRFGDALRVSEPETDAELVAVQDKSGERWCGALTEASPGSLGVSVDGSPVVVSLRDVVAVGPVDSC